MNTKILKFTLQQYGVAIVDMPAGAKLLHVADQCGAIQLWVEGDLDAMKQGRRIGVFYTGDDAPEARAVYIGTALTQGGSIVSHVYDLTFCEKGGA